METSTQTATRLPFGRASFGRRVIGEYGIRSIGNIAAYLFKGISGPDIATPGPCSSSTSAGGMAAGSNERVFVARL